ncbi:MAG: hypothetical protein Q9188_002368 [Gyalolechia gomerana]
MAPTEISPKASVSPQPPATPPGSPTLTPSPQSIVVDDLKRLVAGLIKEAQNAESTDKVQASASIAEKDVPPTGSGARASRLEYKTVDEHWNDKTSRYETVESTPAGEVDGLDKYIFVARARIDKKTSEPVFYVDIKSEKLRDILRTVLQNIHGISLREDKPQIERNLLYQYLPELEAYRTKLSDDVGQDAAELKHLSLLADFSIANTPRRWIVCFRFLRMEKSHTNYFGLSLNRTRSYIPPVLTRRNPYAFGLT